MPTSIAVNLDPSRVQVEPGAQATATVIVRNRSEEVAHYLLQIEGLAPDWAEIAPDQVSAFPLQETRAVMTIHPPNGATAATYHLIVRATAQENGGLEGQGLLDVDVPAPARPEVATTAAVVSPTPTETPRPQAATQIELRAEPLKDSKLPPPAAQWRLSLHNASNVLDTFGFNIGGLRSNWVNIEPAALTLKPDEEGNAILTVRPGSDTPGKVYPFTLRVFSHLNVSQRTELALKIDVQQSTAFKIALAPRDAESQGAREFQVSLRSDPASNTDLWLDLSASDQDNACDYTFEPKGVFLPAKQTLTSTLRVVPHAVLGPNERKTYTIRVVATPRGRAAPPQTDEARLTQTGATPLTLAMRPQVSSGEMSAEYTVTVINPSTVQTNVVLAGQDPADACDYIFQPSRLAIPPNGQVQVLTIVEAHSATQGEKQQDVPFTISATRVGELVPAAKVDGKFTQLPLKPVGLFLIPPQQSQPGRARYFVKVRNPHASPIHIWLDAQDDEDALAFAFQPSEIQLSGGSEGMSTLMARPKDKLSNGQARRVHKFTVTGSVDGSRTKVTANGTLAQTAATDWVHVAGVGLRWGIRALKWTIALLIVLFLGTVFLAGTARIAEQNPEMGRLVYSILSPSLIRGLVNVSPFSGPARGIVYVLEYIINTLLVRR